MMDIRYSGDSDFKIETVGYVSVQREQGFSFEYKSGKEQHSFIYVQHGMLDYWFPETGKKIQVKKGSVIYIPKHLPYKTKYLVDNTTIKIITFDTTSDALLPPPFTILSSAEISFAFESISLLNAYNTLFLTSKLYEILYIAGNDTNNIPKKYEKILPALNEMNYKYFENHKVDVYAKMCNMSEQNFRRLFKAYTGSSPIEYRNSLRLFAVKRMVESGEFTVSQAAYIAGFNNMSFFYSIYHKKEM